MSLNFKGRRWAAVAVASTLFAAGPGAHAANILANAGFETGGLSPWYQSIDGGGAVNWGVDTLDSHSGTYSAVDDGNKELQQDFAATAASSITQVSFWMRHPNEGTAPMAYDFFYSDHTSQEFSLFSSSTNWQFFDVTSQLDTSKSLTGFGLWGYYSGAGTGQVTRYDDVTINVGGGAVPEPESWALMIGGLGLAGAALRRRRQALAI